MKLRITITSFIVVLVVVFASQDRFLCHGLGSNIINVLIKQLYTRQQITTKLVALVLGHFCDYSRLPIIRTFNGNRKKVRVIESSSYREFDENSRE